MSPADQAAARKAIGAAGTGALTSGDRIFALAGALSDIDAAWLSEQLRWLSRPQIEHLATGTDFAAREPRFRQQLAAQQQLATAFESVGESAAFVRDRLGAWISARVLTPELTAKAQAILLTGQFEEQVRGIFERTGRRPATDSPLREPNRAALEALEQANAAEPEAELFLRANAYELARLEPSLVQRLIRNLGRPALERQVPELIGLSGPEIARVLTDRAGLGAYLEKLRPTRAIEPFTPDPLAERAHALGARIERADQFARAEHASLASPDALRIAARFHYRSAIEDVRALLAEDPKALRLPEIKAWTERRFRALFLEQAAAEVQSGRRPGLVAEAIDRARTNLADRLPAFGALRPKVHGAAEGALIDTLQQKLGFWPDRRDPPLSPPEQLALRRTLAELLLDDPGAEDPLIGLGLGPEFSFAESARPKHLVFAPGVIPIRSVLAEPLTHLATRGLETHVAETGFFRNEAFNASRLRDTLDAIFARDPDPEIVFLGYSQGAGNILRLLDDLRRESPTRRAQIDRAVRSVISLYGAHNGSLPADHAVPTLERALDFVPRGDRLEYALSSINPLAHWVGGINSLKRTHNRDFWNDADLPVAIPYFSFTAKPHSANEVPRVLRPSYRSLAKGSETLGLGADNDTQVFVSEARAGNEYSAMGREIRAQNVDLTVRGHHWNALSPIHNLSDPSGCYAFPKRAQVETAVDLLGELGLFGRAEG